MLLLTGATGTIGAPLLRRLNAAGTPVRCLVRDPRRLGAERVRVQIAIGDLGDPPSFRHALRGVDTVVHLAGSIRDQPRGSIEELNGVATWRMVRAAERAGVKRFVFASALGSSSYAPARVLRAKALAERALAQSDMPHAVFAPSLVYAPGESWLRLIERLALLPALPLSGRGAAEFQPIWADDVAACIVAMLERAEDGGRVELAGPHTLSYEAIVELALRSFGKRRPVVPVPRRIARRGLRTAEVLFGPAAIATWDEAALLDVSMTSATGTAGAESLGVTPRSMQSVLAAAA